MHTLQRRSVVLFISLAIAWAGWPDAETAAQRRNTRTFKAAVYQYKPDEAIDHIVKILGEERRFKVDVLSPQDIRDGKLEAFDVLVCPGGRGSRQGLALGEEGREQVRSFVSGGGGYVGICAGAYLATSTDPWYLHILDAKFLDREHWARGDGEVTLKLTRNGKRILGSKKAAVKVYYNQGPLLAPADKPDIPDYDELAAFQTEVAKKGAPRGVMKGTTAIASATFGDGRVLCFSPHPDLTAGLQDFVRRGAIWASRRPAKAEPKRRRTNRPSTQPQ